MTLRAEQRREDRRTSEEELSRRIVGRSAALRTLRERALALAPLDVPVLIRGEPGTGRAHTARALHAAADRGSGPLLRIACGDDAPPRLPPRAPVVFLDEVSALAPPAQARWAELLRRSEDGLEGAPRRVLASSARDLQALVREEGFDPELASRLRRFQLELPPLRERREDVPALARALAERAAGGMGRSRVRFTRDALRLLAAQSWPGNVRELAGVVERLVAFSRDGRIPRSQAAALLDETPAGVLSSRRSAAQRQREELVALIEETGGNLAEVARRLRMSRGGVIYRAQKFGLLPRRSGGGRP